MKEKRKNEKHMLVGKYQGITNKFLYAVIEVGLKGCRGNKSK